MSALQQRSIVLLDQRLQLRMVAVLIAVQVLLSGLFAYALFLFTGNDPHAAQAAAHDGYQSLSQVLSPIVGMVAVFSVTLAVVLATIFAAVLSRKVTAPMYRLRAVLEALAERRFESFRSLHPDDQLVKIAATLDKAVETVREDIQDVRIEVARARSNLAAGQMSELTDRLDTLDLVLLRWDGVERNP